MIVALTYAPKRKRPFLDTTIKTSSVYLILLLKLQSWTKIVGTLVHNSVFFLDIQFPSSPPHLSMLCCCERDEQTSLRIMSDYNIDLGEWGVSSFPALMAKIV